jgi:membrane peptidoglycan carboxypeptidase
MKRLALVGLVFLVMIVGSLALFIRKPYSDLAAKIEAASTKPPMIRNAVITAETRVDMRGATITQQFVKNASSNRRRALSRHLEEFLVTVAVDARFTDEQILAGYLEHVYLGQRTYGVDQAARSYFGKTISQLTLAECALLAGLIRSPSVYSPARAPHRALRRRNEVLAKMRDRGFISASMFEVAVHEPLPNRG